MTALKVIFVWIKKSPKIIILKIKKGLKSGEFSVGFKSVVKYAQKGSKKCDRNMHFFCFYSCSSNFWAFKIKKIQQMWNQLKGTVAPD